MWGDRGAIPGLIFAAPVVLAGLALFGLSRVATDRSRRDLTGFLAATAIAHAALIALTQYAAGGSGEWGWRYAHIALPAVLPLAACGLDAVATRVDRRTSTVVSRSWIAVTVCYAVLMVFVQRNDRQAPERIGSTVSRAMGLPAGAALSLIRI